MADFTDIINEINAVVKTNGLRDITGLRLNAILRGMIVAVDENLPQLYSEDLDNNLANLTCDLFKFSGGSFIVRTANYEFRFSDETGLEVTNHTNTTKMQLTNQDFTVEFANRMRLQITVDDFTIGFFDGSDWYNMSLSINNGLAVGDVNVVVMKDEVDLLKEKVLDLQRQIDELKNQ